MDNTYLQILSQPTPPRSGIKSKYIQHCYSSGSTRRGSSSYIESNQRTPQAESNDPSYLLMNEKNDSVSAMSGIFELESKGQTSFLRGDSTSIIDNEMNTAVLLEGDPSTCFTDSLYEDFLDFFISYSGEHEVFNLLLNYEELCCKHIEKLKKISCKVVSADTKFHKTFKMLSHLQEERNMWRLLRTLFQDRLESENVDESDMMFALGKKFSDKKIIDNLYQRDSYVRESQLIIDWLEKNYSEDNQEAFSSICDRFIDNCSALEHSLNFLTTNPDFNKNSMRFSELELDPDAYHRQKNYPLHETDRENERRLLKYMFLCIRAGNLDQAQQLAEKFGEPCLAAALEGWRPYHDSNYDENMVVGQVLLPVEGNKDRDIWKAACWTASQTPVIPVYEQAVYGSLCGNLKAMLSVCISWEDYLWAYVRASLDKLIEKEVRGATQQERMLEEMPVEYWDNVLGIEEIFQELEASDSNEIKCQSKIPLHIMQKYIILDDLDGLVEEMYNWLSNVNVKLEGQMLRSMVHLILFLRVVGRSSKEELCVPILEAYVQELIKAHKIALVAPYTSTLPKEQQIIWYARFLEGITDNAERQKCLQFAEDAGLDVSQITRTVVKNIREKEPVNDVQMTDLSAVTTEDDVNKINAIDWLIFDPAQRAEATKQANALMRIFVAQKKIEAAKKVFNKVPSDSVAIMMQLAKAKGHEELLADDDNATREYLCFKAYLEAMDAFNNWFHHSINAKPKQPVAPSGDITFKEKVAYEHELLQYEKDLERWSIVVKALGTTASDCLYNVLLFVNGGWLVDQRSDGTVDENRQLQMARLRKQCIPHVTRLLQELLIHEERHSEAVRLADVIASERYQLYKEFTREDLKHFLRVSLDSSIALLVKNLDPLGYNYQ